MSAALESLKMAAPRTPKGGGTDQELLEIVSRRPGLSKYELARSAKWSIGKTDGAIVRLAERRLVYLMVLERDGRRVNLVYPAGYVEPSYISVHAEVVPLGVVSAVVYALNSSTIGVSWEDNDDWGRIALRAERVALRASNGDVIFDLPSGFKWFYGFDHRHHVVSIMEEGLLITVSGEIRKI